MATSRNWLKELSQVNFLLMPELLMSELTSFFSQTLFIMERDLLSRCLLSHCSQRYTKTLLLFFFFPFSVKMRKPFPHKQPFQEDTLRPKCLILKRWHEVGWGELIHPPPKASSSVSSNNTLELISIVDITTYPLLSSLVQVISSLPAGSWSFLFLHSLFGLPMMLYFTFYHDVLKHPRCYSL